MREIEESGIHFSKESAERGQKFKGMRFGLRDGAAGKKAKEPD
jgi:hypothetical protein